MVPLPLFLCVTSRSVPYYYYYIFFLVKSCCCCPSFPIYCDRIEEVSARDTTMKITKKLWGVSRPFSIISLLSFFFHSFSFYKTFFFSNLFRYCRWSSLFIFLTFRFARLVFIEKLFNYKVLKQIGNHTVRRGMNFEVALLYTYSPCTFFFFVNCALVHFYTRSLLFFKEKKYFKKSPIPFVSLFFDLKRWFKTHFLIIKCHYFFSSLKRILRSC